MGKERLSNSYSSHHLYSPWFTSNVDPKKQYRFKQYGLFGKEEEIEDCIDEYMKQTIMQIENEYQHRISNNIDEEEDDILLHDNEQDMYEHHDGGLTLSGDNVLYQSQIQLSEADEQIERNFIYKYDIHLVTLQDIVNRKRILALDNNDKKPGDHLSISNPKVTMVYTKIGELLSQYQSENIPKALKIIPMLSNWDEILYLTLIEQWSPQAVYEITCIFMTNVKATQAIQFFRYVLLGCTRRNILKNNGSALDYPIFKAIEKAVQTNPTLFFRGFLFPLCESNQCSVKEACLISSILGQSTSISSAHTTSALIALAETPYYTVSTSVFILAFIEKKHVVPFRAIESLTCHFYSMVEEERETPRVWYESLYAFIKCYLTDMVIAQKQRVLELIEFKHEQPEICQIIRELLNSDDSMSVL